jgi:hypothetical protein
MGYYTQDMEGQFPAMSGDWRRVFYWGTPLVYVGFGELRPYVETSSWFDDVGARVPNNMMRRGVFSDPTSFTSGYGDWCNILYVLPFCAENSRGGSGTYFPFVPPLEENEYTTTAMGTCYINSNPWASDPFRAGAHDGDGFNVVRLDAHVDWVPEAEVYEAGLQGDTYIKMNVFNAQ